MKVVKCIVCNKEAIAAIRIDIDVSGIGYCTEHETEVQVAYLALLTGEEKVFDKLLKSYEKKQKKNSSLG